MIYISLSVSDGSRVAQQNSGDFKPPICEQVILLIQGCCVEITLLSAFETPLIADVVGDIHV